MQLAVGTSVFDLVQAKFNILSPPKIIMRADLCRSDFSLTHGKKTT